MDSPQGIPQLLPGMSRLTDPSGRCVAAVEATLAALHAADLLEPRHAATAQLCLELALAVEHGLASRRASAVALAARELREALASLPEPQQTGGDAFAQLLEELNNAG